jgi:hypothetical protein
VIAIRVLVVVVVVVVAGVTMEVGIATTMGDLGISLGSVLTMHVELCAAEKWC